ncbi:MAG TPA: prenyltransferase [Methanomassiliicoccales archaeon]|jgi:1,4-dihydroxy-2-naphthoate octaprenyltransferase|nr:prenyltransferase [Euryarchaeota archaeon]HOE52333.1 prenyltransferase [Methanomassiliicoccales archaeon]HPD08496.1 prenyltransferase [Methanomassiliicoccales archaeon]HQM66559.1 prenyltransferase [Methanomassiliicoccales archaeon]
MEKRGLYRTLLNMLRISYTLPFVMASVTGAAFALTVCDEWLLAAVIPLDIFFFALFANLSNDYFDHRSGTDATRFDFLTKEREEAIKELYDERVYWEGNIFDRGEVSERTGKLVLALILALAIITAVPIIRHGGPLVIVLGAIGLFLAYFYTAPPLNLGARGLGELDVGVSFFMMAFFTYYVIWPEWSWQMFLIALLVGTSVMLMRFVDQMSGYEAHLKGGERDWCVRLGLERAVTVVGVILVAVHAMQLALVYFHPVFLVLLLTVPMSRRMMKGLHNKEDELRFIRPAPQIVKMVIVSEVLIVISLIVQSALPWTLW